MSSRKVKDEIESNSAGRGSNPYRAKQWEDTFCRLFSHSATRYLGNGASTYKYVT
jgi:hypothetical protein